MDLEKKKEDDNEIVDGDSTFFCVVVLYASITKVRECWKCSYHIHGEKNNS